MDRKFRSYSSQEDGDSKKKFYIAISDDGREVVKFNTVTQTLETFKVSYSRRIGRPQFEPTGFSYNVKSDYISTAERLARWSIAISNAINEDGLTIVALSFYVTDKQTDKNEQEKFLLKEDGGEDSERNSPDYSSTRVFIIGDSKNTVEQKTSSTKNARRIATSVDYVAGIVNFTPLPNSKYKWLLTVLNEEGLFQHKINPNKTGAKDTVHAYDLKDGKHILEFSNHKNPSLVGLETPIYAISNNRALLAACLDNTSVAIYLLENSLECGKKHLMETQRVTLIEFINDDEWLLILKEDRDTHDVEATIWELFTCRPVRNVKINELNNFFQNPSNILYSTACAGNTPIYVSDDGELRSFLEHIILDSEEESLDTSNEIELECPKVYELEESTKSLKKSSGRLIVDKMWPWKSGDDIIGVWLDKDKRKQFIIEKTCVQLWKKIKNGKPRLLYMYVKPKKGTEKFTSSDTEEAVLDDMKERISVLDDTKEGISVLDDIKEETTNLDKKEYENLTSGYSANKPRIAIDGEKFRFRKTADENSEYNLEIRWPLDPCKVVIDACQALYEYVDKDSKQKEGNYIKYYELKHQLTDIVRRFIRKHPNEWRLLEVRYELMQCLLCGGCSRLIKELVAVSDVTEGEHSVDEGNKYMRNWQIPLHFPREYTWETDEDGNPTKKKSDLIITIEEKAKLTDNFLTYYAHFSNEHFGWICTVRKALHCLIGKEHLDIPKNRFFAHPSFMGIPTSQHEIPLRTYSNIFGSLPKLTDNLKLLRVEKVVENMRHVQLKTDMKTIRYMISSRNLFYFIVIPSYVWEFALHIWHIVYRTRDPEKSPETYVKVLRRVPMPCDENVAKLLQQFVNDEYSEIIFDNPAIAGLINSTWAVASFYYQAYMLLHIYFLLAFGTFVFYFNDTDKQRAIAYITGALGICLVILELLTIPWLTSTQEDYIGSTILHILTAAATFMLWLKLLMLLKPYEGVGTYVYIIISIFEHISLFFVSLFLLVFAIGHTMYVFLHDPSDVNLTPDSLSFGVNLTTPNGPVETNYTVYQILDEKTVSDNNFANLWNSVISTYGWTNGRWDGLDWNSYALKLFVIVSSLLLVIVLLNILIAIIGDVYVAAKITGRRAIVRSRAIFLVYYCRWILNAIRESNSQYIYVFGNHVQFENWGEEKKKFRNLTDPLAGRAAKSDKKINLEALIRKIGKEIKLFTYRRAS
ncbi:1323_t:CDS:2 [Paraglomus occultum]|uniref:1323_t:CDS:1 n=1 Tax=Paraglomus occultum TaxID=144539 RepID=A0A9N9CJN0_9GLOM|nr:1323_t:CDS:2 [Paraglomus occultum]